MSQQYHWSESWAISWAVAAVCIAVVVTLGWSPNCNLKKGLSSSTEMPAEVSTAEGTDE